MAFSFLLVSWCLCRSRLFFVWFGLTAVYIDMQELLKHNFVKIKHILAQNIRLRISPHVLCLVYIPLYTHVGCAFDFFNGYKLYCYKPFCRQNLADITVFHQHNVFQLMSQNTLWYDTKRWYKWFLLGGGLPLYC